MQNPARVFVVPALLFHILLQIIAKLFYGIGVCWFWSVPSISQCSMMIVKQVTMHLFAPHSEMWVWQDCVLLEKKKAQKVTSHQTGHPDSVFIQVCNLVTLHIFSGELTNILLQHWLQHWRQSTRLWLVLSTEGVLLLWYIINASPNISMNYRSNPCFSLMSDFFKTITRRYYQYYWYYWNINLI